MICYICAKKLKLVHETEFPGKNMYTREWECPICGWRFVSTELSEEKYNTLKLKAANFDLMISDHSRQKARELIERHNG